MLFTEIVRQQVVPYWEGSFDHPFITGLQDGTLDPTVFRYYLLQDRYYLQHFSQLYLAIAQKTTDPAVRDHVLAGAENLALGEEAVRGTFFQELQITDAEIAATPIAPTAYHYVSHMYRQLSAGTANSALAGMLPCSWLYQEIGERLIQQGSPDPLYQRWIETYAGADSAAEQRKVCQLVDRLYQNASSLEQEQMIEAFCVSSQMEYAFWEMAYQLEKWPAGGKVYVTDQG